jgi:uncharacterized membrane protein
MAEAVAQWLLGLLGGVPDSIKVIALSVMPITEYKLAIPVALTQFHFSVLMANMLVFLGNLIIFFPLFFGLEGVRSLASRYLPFLVRPIDSLVARAHRKLHSQYEKYGALALFVFVFIPLPLTGVWTGTLAAVALKIPFGKAAAGILLGALASQILVTALTLSVR